ncbi:two-component system activity regulator YycH [Solibacillus sp. CAU 1738]|uniref:YycH family regulatory protein n=1 Tax=Solibacillus sp. CAU 1738 TaxID=3140363 RepID=UPI003260BBAC
MKYIEHIKSVVLFLLVSLSLLLTFMAWSYQPNYKTMEDVQVEQVYIGNKKTAEQVIKPYRILFREDDVFTGSVSSTVIDSFMSMIPKMQAQDFTLINNNLSDVKINEMQRINDRMTLFFPTDVPLPAFSTILPFSDKDLPETTFNRIIVDWSRLATSSQLQFLFISTENRTSYRSYVTVFDETKLLRGFIKPALNFAEYVEVERPDALSLYTVSDGIELTQYTYYIDEISPNLFKNILFTDPNIVQRNIESVQYEKYDDGMSLMTVDTQSKIINYVYPAAESLSLIPASRLFEDSFDFLNEHGGITADYRFSAMNLQKHVTEYQLYLQGYPVYSNDTLTRITTTWGDDRIFRYRRPYYSLIMDIPGEKTVKELASGPEILEYIKHHTDYQLQDVKDIVVGYYLVQNQNVEWFTLVPSWFMITDAGWTHITPERLGGIEYGLE